MPALFALFIILFQPANAATQTFNYDTELCSCKAQYNPKKVTQKQLKNLTQLAGSLPSYRQKELLTFRRDFSKFDKPSVAKEVQAIQLHYSQAVKEFQSRDLPKSSSIEEVRKDTVAYALLGRDILIAHYQYTLTGDLKFLKPASIPEKVRYQCVRFIESLKTKPIRQVYSEFQVEACKSNMDPAGCVKRGNWRTSKVAQRAYIVGMGWGNCIRQHSEGTVGRGEDYKISMDTLNSYLIDKKCECDEP